MEKINDTTATDSPNTAEEMTGERKAWKTPSLRILPVPGKTQGGPFAVDDQDDRFYRKS